MDSIASSYLCSGYVLLEARTLIAVHLSMAVGSMCMRTLGCELCCGEGAQMWLHGVWVHSVVLQLLWLLWQVAGLSGIPWCANLCCDRHRLLDRRWVCTNLPAAKQPEVTDSFDSSHVHLLLRWPGHCAATQQTVFRKRPRNAMCQPLQLMLSVQCQHVTAYCCTALYMVGKWVMAGSLGPYEKVWCASLVQLYARVHSCNMSCT